jgi:hypothetical protein
MLIMKLDMGGNSMEYFKSGIYILVTLLALILSGINGCSIVNKNPNNISIKELSTVLPMSSGFADKIREKQ